MREVATSRRDAMRALAIVPTLIAAPAIANVATGLVCTPTGISAGMTTALAAYRHAEKVSASYDDTVYGPPHKAWREAVDAIPHHVTQGYQANGGWTHMSTRTTRHLAVAKTVMKEPALWDHSPEYQAACAELLKASCQREQEEARLRARYNIDALYDESVRLSDKSYEALRAVEEYPVETLTDLIAKIDFIKETGGTVDADELLGDLCRIAGEALA